MPQSTKKDLNFEQRNFNRNRSDQNAIWQIQRRNDCGYSRALFRMVSKQRFSARKIRRFACYHIGNQIKRTGRNYLQSQKIVRKQGLKTD